MKRHEAELLMDLQRLILELSDGDNSIQHKGGFPGTDAVNMPTLKVSGIRKGRSTFKVSYALSIPFE